LTSTLNDKDTGDAYGDIFFYLGDRLQEPMACRHDPSWEMCRTKSTLDRDSVYTMTVLEVDSTFGGCPSGARTCSKYGACNPIDPSGSEPWQCIPTTPKIGKANVTDRYPRAHGKTQFDLWKFQASRLMGGFWYSTQRDGNCDEDAASDCQWRVLRTAKTVNATCANSKLHAPVIAANETCFNGCGDDQYDITSDCWISCFYTTLFGGEIVAHQLADPWLKAFSSDDPADGGCPNVPPYVPPEISQLG